MRKVWVVLILILFIIYAFSSQTQNLKIHFLDVGEGDSILIQTPKGNTVLVDTGNLITGFKVVKYLQKNDIQDLDYLILTHPHLDHIGGTFLILQMINVKKIYDNGQDLSQLIELFDILERELDVKLSYTKLSWRKSDQKVFVADINKARNLIGWQSRVDKVKGIKKMLQWITNNHYQSNK